MASTSLSNVRRTQGVSTSTTRVAIQLFFSPCVTPITDVSTLMLDHMVGTAMEVSGFHLSAFE
jgi:hypothetical protein